ncbi:MAG: nucleoside-triphosphatase [Anaerolineaceae bacterium]|jgi:nucleoside-triphosphatase THEP1|nr:nucleoside-triphosphatase [Anaerolineaceae bacterium]
MDNKGKLIIISGWRGSGKTTFCRRVIAAAGERGWQAAGVLSPAEFKGGTKSAILIEDITTGERRQMAYWPAALEGQRPEEVCTDENPYDPNWKPHWIFDKEKMAWGEEILAAVDQCDLLVIDELGPFELVHGEGWVSGLRLLDAGDYRLAIVVIRPELIEQARQRWPQASVVELREPEDIPGVFEIVKGNLPGECK